MDRICRHAFKIETVWRAYNPSPESDTPPHITGEDERMRYAGWSQINNDDRPENWQCGWRVHDMPAPIQRAAGGNHLRAGDCDTCKFFEPVDVKIPGVKSST